MKPWTLESMRERLSELAAGLGDSEVVSVRRRILEAATEHFTRFGYRKANIAEIARGAGVGKGTIYLHFDGKLTLLAAAIALEKMSMMPEMQRIMGLPPIERLGAYLRMAIRFAITAPLTSAVGRGDGDLKQMVEHLGEGYQNDRERSVAFIVQLVEPHTEGRSDEERAKLVEVLLGAIYTAAHLPAPPVVQLSPDEFVEHYVELLVRGLERAP